MKKNSSSCNTSSNNTQCLILAIIVSQFNFKIKSSVNGIISNSGTEYLMHMFTAFSIHASMVIWEKIKPHKEAISMWGKNCIRHLRVHCTANRTSPFPCRHQPVSASSQNAYQHSPTSKLPPVPRKAMHCASILSSCASAAYWGPSSACELGQAECRKHRATRSSSSLPAAHTHKHASLPQSILETIEEHPVKCTSACSIWTKYFFIRLNTYQN